MMNSRKRDRFIFITPYLTEVERIKNACKERGFVSPEKEYDTGFKKINCLHKLLDEKKNIASTHALFSWFTEETAELIKKNGYILVLDEVSDIFQQFKICEEDINILYKGNVLKEEDGNIRWADEDYAGEIFRDVKLKARSNNLIKINDEHYFWEVPCELYKVFKEVYILTYMFEFQIQKYYFDINNIIYELIGVRKFLDSYEFCKMEEMNRKIDLTNKIHICDIGKLNDIGAERCELSLSWYSRETNTEKCEKIKLLSNNVRNYFLVKRKAEANECLWTTYKEGLKKMKINGFNSCFIPYNIRACNDYADRKYLAFLSNIFLRQGVVIYFRNNGIEPNQEMYGLSVLIQWIFRSAVRRGEEVWLYLPSSRMRYLLEKWLINLKEGKDLEPISMVEYSDILKNLKSAKILREHSRKSRKK